jgi:hypothetical protein
MDDKLRVKLLVRFSNVHDDYFGIGYENNSTIEQGSETSRYNNQLFKVKPGVDIRIMPNLYLGAAYLFSDFKVKEANPVMMADPNFMAFGPKILESGPIFSATFDSRDIVVNAYSGLFFNTSYYRSTSWLGGNQDFESYEFDTRFYQTLNRLGNTLAFRIYAKQAVGEVPYSAMTLIGSSDLLRGYLNGQYRDKTGLVLLGEWRYMFLDKNHEPGKHGMVAWLGTGSVGNNFRDLNNWLPNAGIGYRFEVQPRMNVRVDFGIGKNSTGLYFNFSEAF